jgi:hypothetical protein
MRVLSVAMLVLLTTSGFGQVRIDHAIAVVANLDSAVTQLKATGFTIKPGRLHDNGLLNAHIKFPNGTEFELMSIQGTPKDDMARDYLDLLHEHEGGAYLALSGISIETLNERTTSMGIEHKVEKGAAWSYITFPHHAYLSPFFFIEMHIGANDTPALLTHHNGSIQMATVWVEGDDRVTNFLKAMGLISSGTIVDAKLGRGEKFSTSTGAIVVAPPKDASKRQRIIAMSFCGKDGKETVRLVF